MREPTRVYQFKLLLLAVAPPIWRRIQVPETYSFWDLHVALQDAMGWLDYHLHLFRVTKPVTGEVVQIGIPDDDAFEGDEPIVPGWEVPIAHYFPRPGAVARYDYKDVLTVIQTPTHEEYESTLQWLGGRFDPEAFESKHVKFDDPARRYELAFEERLRGRPRRRRKTRPDNTRLQRSRARRARR